MTRKNFLFFLIGVIFLLYPSTTNAAWWNLKDWFNTPPSVVVENENPEITPEIIYIQASTTACIPQVITKTVPIQDSSKDVLIRTLEAQVSQLQALLNQKQNIPNTIPVIKTISATSDSVKDLKLKLIELDAFEKAILNYESDRVATSTKFRNLMITLNSFKDVDGTPIFTVDNFLPHVVSINPDYNENNNPPKFEWVRDLINKTRVKLTYKLTVAEANQ